MTATVGWALPVYREGPPPAHTGGFGEPLCSECHFGGPLNAEPGSLTVDAPAAYAPGEIYTVTVALAHPELEAAGFQLAIRFAAGPGVGGQAGGLEATDARTAVTVDGDVAYAHQTPEGSTPTDAGAARWTVVWTAPDSDVPVALHVSANAANDDDSEFGDHVYAASAVIDAVTPTR